MPPGLAAASHALSLPKGAPDEHDRPRRRSRRPHVIPGQMTIDEVLQEMEEERRRASEDRSQA
jgi:hypothetical protein